jgi:hypothetical protein
MLSVFHRIHTHGRGVISIDGTCLDNPFISVSILQSSRTRYTVRHRPCDVSPVCIPHRGAFCVVNYSSVKIWSLYGSATPYQESVCNAGDVRLRVQLRLHRRPPS